MYDRDWFVPMDEHGEDPERVPSLSDRMFAGLIGVFILLGFALSALAGAAVSVAGSSVLFVYVGFVGAYVGYLITTQLAKTTGAALGFVLANLSLGAGLTPLLQMGALYPLRGVILLTVLGTIILTGVAFASPVLIRRRGSFVLAALVALPTYHILVLFSPLLADLPDLTVRTGLLATAFLAYVDFYWSRALVNPPNMINVIDTATAVYVNVIERTLRIVDGLVRHFSPRASMEGGHLG